jgi:archaellum component FlaF (FlaF/FlaG flagellin family)
MELMAESKKLYQKIQELETELKALKSASDNPAYLFTLTKVNSDQSLVDIGIYTNGRAIVLDSDVYYDTEMLFERSDSTVTVYVGGNGSYVYNLKNFKSKLLVIKMEFGNPPDLPCKSWLMNTTVSNITSSDILESSGGVYYNENTGEEEFNCSIGDCSYIQNYIDINGY